MNTLIIDCSNGLKVIALVNQKQFEYTDTDAKKQSDSLLASIDTLLKQAKIKVTDLNVIAVCVGPGSFTGIRVAIATAKGLAIGTNAKIITFNSFEAISAGLTDRNYGIMVEGFGNNYYYYFKKYGKIFQGCASPDKLTVLAKDIPIYSNSPMLINAIKEFDIQEANYCATESVKQKIEKQQFINTNQIAPLYLRASQAEIERLKNGNKV